MSIDKMLGNNLTADTASDTPVTGEWVLTGKKLESYLSMGKKKKKESRQGNKGFLYTRINISSWLFSYLQIRKNSNIYENFLDLLSRSRGTT